MVFLCIMIVMAISPVLAIDFTFDYPQEIGLDAEFEVTINSQNSETHDVKIFVHDDIKASSEILTSEGWKSTHYYLKSSFPEQKKFTLKAYYLGETEICVRLRLSGRAAYDESCSSITVKEIEQNNEEPEEIEEEQEELIEDPTEEQEDSQEEQSNEKIVLNSPAKEEFQETQEKTKKYDFRLWISLGFSIFTIFIIILLALGKL